MPIKKLDADGNEKELDICWIGRKINEFDDLKKHIDEESWDFLAIPLTKPPPCLEQAGTDLPEEYDSVASADYLSIKKLAQEERDWVVGVASSWISTDSNRVSEKFKQYSLSALREEVDLAVFWGTRACILPTPDSLNCARYANAILEALDTPSYRVWVRIPMTMDPKHFDGGLDPKVPAARPLPAAAAAAAASGHPAENVPAPANGAAAALASFSNLSLSDEDNEAERRRVLEQSCTSDDKHDGWRMYKSLRAMCDYPSLSVALVMTKVLPPLPYLDRWFSESIAALIIPSECFVEDSDGSPQLPDRHTQVVQRLLRQKAKVVLEIDRTNQNDVQNFLRYRHCIEKLCEEIEELDAVQKARHRDQDCLQPPLQPLANNFQPYVYSALETDPVKYDRYKEALVKALNVKVLERREEGVEGPLVLTVVGAGRGSQRLVNACIEAIKEADKTTEDIKLVALERNENAFISMNEKKKREARSCPFWSKLQIVHCDMRRKDASVEDKADIMVSDFLGSFGDDKLSPECLDGAQRFLKEDGVSIPQRSVSYACPVSSTKLWTAAKFMYEKLEKPEEEFFGLETPYVGNIVSAYFPAVEGAQPLFTFDYPNWNADELLTSNAHNRRRTEVEFTMTTDALLHGIAGYFYADLFDDVAISIVKETFTQDLASWYPMFFPIEQPMSVQKGDQITFSISRCVDEHYVWYEWSLAREGISTSIHNEGGRAFKMIK
uniref:Protein arginine N-methyltransferase n=1 Tax=Chromera velia CCMP2878 TaxID=1169474 RepID=A0A0G4F2S2_9ALVE|eukprot:Cvel_14871.t1-p1 / transcript=Cvel_14871.t1 / gene=Cvel_14871 / organism=Chromera_velia_CCMP2878 / gene_product=Protein arginine N-methyltransferase 5, putative / transcript_product=Protein arginine N-methyltransferase 5, putative / location=Cvel_scaffold1075:52332-56415(-) / protein_length=723 / sequence_SO=supercontig / SO=protein_coding / is_pseudo=false